MTDQQKKAIIIMRQKGISYPDIVKATGLKEGTIRSFISRMGIPSDKNKPEIFCKQCNTRLLPKRYKRNRLFCSIGCKTIWWNNHRTEHAGNKIKTHICAYCRTVFHSYTNAKYCSQACYFASKKGGLLPHD